MNLNLQQWLSVATIVIQLIILAILVVREIQEHKD